MSNCLQSELIRLNDLKKITLDTKEQEKIQLKIEMIEYNIRKGEK